MIIVFKKSIVFKNDRYSFSKSSKRVDHFQKRSFFSKNETIVFENDWKRIEKRSFNDRFQKRLTTLHTHICMNVNIIIQNINNLMLCPWRLYNYSENFETIYNFPRLLMLIWEWHRRTKYVGGGRGFGVNFFWAKGAEKLQKFWLT